jgi:hypothetical protein
VVEVLAQGLGNGVADFGPGDHGATLRTGGAGCQHGFSRVVGGIRRGAGTAIARDLPATSSIAMPFPRT